jgi:hypothetical protein
MRPMSRVFAPYCRAQRSPISRLPTVSVLRSVPSWRMPARSWRSSQLRPYWDRLSRVS